MSRLVYAERKHFVRHRILLFEEFVFEILGIIDKDLNETSNRTIRSTDFGELLDISHTSV